MKGKESNLSPSAISPTAVSKRVSKNVSALDMDHTKDSDLIKESKDGQISSKNLPSIYGTRPQTVFDVHNSMMTQF